MEELLKMQHQYFDVCACERGKGWEQKLKRGVENGRQKSGLRTQEKWKQLGSALAWATEWMEWETEEKIP